MSAFTPQSTLYEQLGGHEAIAAVVDEFYRRVMADARLAPVFADRDMARQRRHLAAFVGVATGGPGPYLGRVMRDAHRGLGITSGQFAAVAAHLRDALIACEVGASARDAVLGTIAGLQGDIVEG